MPEWLLVGLVQRPHGLEGEVSVQVLTDFPERFVPGLVLAWRRGGEERALQVSTVRPHARRLLLRFEAVSDVEAAAALAGGELSVEESQAFPAPEGFFYSHEIRGWACEDPAGRPLGVAIGVAQTPAGPLLTVEVAPGREALVPFVDGIVVRIERAGRRIVLDPPDGLLELTAGVRGSTPDS
jgi:16S rRNA processing protein RimM